MRLAFLRLAAHPAVFERPLSPSEAGGGVEGRLGRRAARADAGARGRSPER